MSEKKIGSTSLVQNCLSQIKKYNEHVNAFIKVQNEDTILERAREAEDRFNRGMAKGPLDGIPLSYKDNFCTKELTTTCGSNMLRGFTSPYNATAVELLQDAGAIMIGKTNMDEFGMGSANLYSAFGPVCNPYKIVSAHKEIIGIEPKRVAGGSSGGSAAAVASGNSYEDYYLRAQKIRKLIQSDFNKVFSRPNPLQNYDKFTSTTNNNTDKEGVDILITPVAISVSPKISDYAFPPSTQNESNSNTSITANGNDAPSNDSFLNAYVNDVFTIPANLAGIPAISVPFGISETDGYPIGLQLMAQYGDEATLFKVAKILESSRKQS
ncbi:5316_t:CDS:2 [Acaulospora colombiana]|uniref:5316_t:CDS:1 n=1 Tax=Acaulospora colombiana TaxID=27376 RepID=A0ACA9NI86_9GLOM|nr:5316_t:CDS:2 [Acaulospora colombiana]